MTKNPLILISILPLIGMLVLLLASNKNIYFIRIFVLFITCLMFLMSLKLVILFSSNSSSFQFSMTLFFVPVMNLNYIIGVDGISLFFLVLTTFLSVICVLMSWSSIYYFLKEYLICFLLLEFLLIQVFCVLDILLFYIFFESVLIPMFLIMGLWGSSTSKIRAAYQLFIYTLMGSFFMLVGMIYIFMKFKTTDFQILWFSNFSWSEQLFLWFAFFVSFAVKIPMIPFHIWLPEAHAEAPTAGSVILAGILLKLGGYGFLSMSLPLFPLATIYFSPIVFIFSLIAVIYGSLTTLRQIDLKKMIAYSSISHMGFVTSGIFSLNIQGLEGSIFLMLSHGLISSALFFCIGILYDRYKTRIMKYYSGLVQVMPIFVIFISFFTFSNMGFPGTSSFIGEFLILVGIFNINFMLTIFITSSVVFSASYSIWLVNRISYGSLKINYFFWFQDLSSSEFFICFTLFVLMIYLGIYPNFIFNELHMTLVNLLEHFY